MPTQVLLGWSDTDNGRIGERLLPLNPALAPEPALGNVQLTTDVPASVIAAPGTGKALYVTDVLITCGSASVGSYVELTDGSGGTVLWKGYASAGGGGFAVQLKSPIRLTPNTALFAHAVTDGSDIWVSVSGYVGI